MNLSPDELLSLILSALFVLVLGSYAYTYRLSSKLDTFMSNHYAHLAKRVKALERRSRK